MKAITRIIRWIDRGYDGAATSNHVMGLVISVAGIAALSVDNSIVKSLLIAFGVFVFVFFGWRMALSSLRMAAAADRRKRRRS